MWRGWIVLVLLMIVGSAHAEKLKAAEMYQVWYVPFDRDYYAPIDMASVEDQASVKGTMSGPKLDALYEAVAHPIQIQEGPLPTSLDIRVKVKRLSDFSVVYVDRSYAVLVKGRVLAVKANIALEAVGVIAKGVKKKVGK